MANYKILSNMIADRKEGDVVSEKDLAGANIDALVEAGHISVIHKAIKEETDK